MLDHRTLTSVALFAVCLNLAEVAGAADAQYEAVFTATWSGQTHPNAYPVNAHFSPLIGAVHNNQVNFWNPDQTASNGIEQMAETGGRSLLQAEMQAAINAGTASSLILGNNLDSPGATTTPVFTLTSSHPYLTLVTMVAPSPDWFVGVHDLDLRDGAGWKNAVVIDLYAYDAGSDSGVNFESADADTAPRQAIALLGAPFTPSDPPVGTFTIRLVPEPASLWLLAGGLVLCGWRKRSNQP